MPSLPVVWRIFHVANPQATVVNSNFKVIWFDMTRNQTQVYIYRGERSYYLAI